MFEILDKLRRKSDRTKKQIAFFTAFSLAGIIFVVWLSVIYPDFRQTTDKEKKVNNLEPSPISNFNNKFIDGFMGVKDQFSQIKEAISSFSTLPAYYTATTTENLSTTTSGNISTTTPSF